MICKRLCKDINYYQLSNYKSDKFSFQTFLPHPYFYIISILLYISNLSLLHKSIETEICNISTSSVFGIFIHLKFYPYVAEFIVFTDYREQQLFSLVYSVVGKNTTINALTVCGF